MKKTAKKLLSMALAFVMVLSLLPAMSVTALAEDEDDSGTKDAFGISMTEWTQAEKQQAESELPFGTGHRHPPAASEAPQSRFRNCRAV